MNKGYSKEARLFDLKKEVTDKKFNLEAGSIKLEGRLKLGRKTSQEAEEYHTFDFYRRAFFRCNPKPCCTVTPTGAVNLINSMISPMNLQQCVIEWKN
jgi:hypothetical protein